MESIRIARASSQGAFYLSFQAEQAGDAVVRVAADTLQRSALLADILEVATVESPGDGGEESMFSTCRGGAVVYSPPGYLRSWLEHVTTPSWSEAASVAQLLFVLRAAVFLGDDAAARDLRNELLQYSTGDGSLDPHLRQGVTAGNSNTIGPEWLETFLPCHFPFLEDSLVPQNIPEDWIYRYLESHFVRLSASERKEKKGTQTAC